MSERGTASKAALKTKMPTIVEQSGSASPRCVLSSPSSLVIRYAGMIVAWNGIIMQERSTSTTARLPRNGSVSA